MLSGFSINICLLVVQRRKQKEVFHSMFKLTIITPMLSAQALKRDGSLISRLCSQNLGKMSN